jgi:hypothetical protein
MSYKEELLNFDTLLWHTGYYYLHDTSAHIILVEMEPEYEGTYKGEKHRFCYNTPKISPKTFKTVLHASLKGHEDKDRRAMPYFILVLIWQILGP